MPHLAIAAGAALAVVLAILAATTAGITQLVAGPAATPSPAAAAVLDIPPDYLALYTAAAATCPGLDWSVVAAVGAVESDHGRSQLPGVHSGQNPAGAMGPMQFLPATFAEVTARHPPPSGGAQPPSPFAPHDAIHTAAAYLCDNGARDGRDLRAALFTYNRSERYVADVIARAAAYRDTAARVAQNRGADDATGPGGAGGTDIRWPAEQATVPDPAGGAGKVTPRLAALYQALQNRGAITAGASCWGERPDNPNSDHPRGRACDISVNPNDPAEVARGWEIANWITAQQATFGIRNVIWQGQIWTSSNPVWVIYESSAYGCPNPANVTGCHFDHLHISIQ